MAQGRSRQIERRRRLGCGIDAHPLGRDRNATADWHKIELRAGHEAQAGDRGLQPLAHASIVGRRTQCDDRRGFDQQREVARGRHVFAIDQYVPVAGHGQRNGQTMVRPVGVEARVERLPRRR